MSEHEPLNRTKGMVGVCLYPDKGFVETKVRIYNRTPHVQTFLWWENAGVHVNEQYQVFFPPDVHSVVFHARQFTAEFPYVKGFYYAEDFGDGTDVSFYKNIRGATSFFATESNYDFFGGYDHSRQAGVIHVANRHISPGKKFFTWANGPFGHQWQRNLADDEGPYLELMAGVYTDNQPDFSWLHPYETKTFSQFWYPFSRIGLAKNANCAAAINLEVQGNTAMIGVCVTEDIPGAHIQLSAGDQAISSVNEDLSVGKGLQIDVKLPAGIQSFDLVATIRRSDGREVISYIPEIHEGKPVPKPADIPAAPNDVPNNEDLYLIGLHLEQYRHPTVFPKPYWQEALRRDSGDSRSNLMLGRSLLRRGQFAEAEAHLRLVIQRLTRWNFNPYDGEVYYLLGLALRYQSCLDEAYAALYKAIWNYAWQSSGYYALAEIDSLRGDYVKALEHLELSLLTNQPHLKARDLKAALLRRSGKPEKAVALLEETLNLDSLDYWALNEMALACRGCGQEELADAYDLKLKELVGDDTQTILDIAIDYGNAGLLEDGCAWLVRLAVTQGTQYPMVYYALGYFAQQMKELQKSRDYFTQAAQMPPDYCFPFRLEEMLALQAALIANPQDARAAYYLGNLLYDKDRHAEAVSLWETSTRLEPNFAITWRNLGLAAYNHGKDLDKSLACYHKAVEANPHDPRLLYELDQIMKRAGISPQERLRLMEKNLDLVHKRDDLVLELAGLLTLSGQPDKAIDLLQNRNFHPWEGGEGSVSGQYMLSHWAAGRVALEAGRPSEAIEYFAATMHLPQSLGEAGYQENNALTNYYMGLAYEALGENSKAQGSFQEALQTNIYSPADIYYQALALRKLSDESAAIEKLKSLLDDARQIAEKDDKDAFFYPSMPSILFLDDLDELKRIDSLCWQGLAHLGLGQIAEAKGFFEEVLQLDPSHQSAWEEYKRLG